MRFLLLATLLVAQYDDRSRYIPNTPTRSYAYETKSRFIPPVEDSQEFLYWHNKYRRDIGSPDIQWDSELELDARTYSLELVSKGCGLRHSDRTTRPTQGENLYWNSGTYGNYIFKALYVWCLGPLSGANHHTQVVWPTSTYVGCASIPSNCGTIVTCRYSPPGNIGSWSF